MRQKNLYLVKTFVASTLAVLLTLNSISLVSAAMAEQQKFYASDAAAGDSFGSSVAISEDGNYAVIGASGDNSGAGSAYVFVRSGSTWSQQEKLTAGIDSSANDGFGSSVAIDATGSRVIIGSPAEDGAGSDRGAAYVFERTGNDWDLNDTITEASPANNNAFGASVSINDDGTYIAIGATGGNGVKGTAYVFNWDGDSWEEQGHFLPSGLAISDRFGSAVDLSAGGDYLAVGSDGRSSNTGATYMFTRTGASWNDTTGVMVTASDAFTSDRFGNSVSMSASGDYVAVGAYTKNGNEGAVYVFVENAGDWDEQEKLTANTPAAGENFGISVDISDDGLFASVSTSDPEVSIFNRSGANWTESDLLTNGGDGSNGFGISASISDQVDYVLVGAFGDNDLGTNAGAAYTFVDAVTSDITPDISTDVIGGAFTITGVGEYDGTIDLSSLTAPVLTATESYFNASYTDYFTIRDNDGDSGARVRTYFSDSVWNYSGTAYSGSDNTISATSTRLVPKIDTATFANLAPTKFVTSSVTTGNLQSRYTFLVAGESSSPGAESASLFSFPDVNLSHYLPGTTTVSDGEIFRSQSTAPLKGNLRIDRLEVTIPEQAAIGQYTNTLNVTLIPGS